MNKNFVTIGINVYNVLNSFANGYEREDHYTDGNGIYRFCSLITMLNGKVVIDKQKPKKTRKNIKSVIKSLGKLSIKPDSIFIFNDLIQISWYPAPYYAIMDCRSAYLKASLEFARYIDNLELGDIKMNTGSFRDDPVFNKDMFGDCKKATNPGFSAVTFGSNNGDDIEIIDFIDVMKKEELLQRW